MQKCNVAKCDNLSIIGRFLQARIKFKKAWGKMQYVQLYNKMKTWCDVEVSSQSVNVYSP